jgi:hypothetical protein
MGAALHHAMSTVRGKHAKTYVLSTFGHPDLEEHAQAAGLQGWGCAVALCCCGPCGPSLTFSAAQVQAGDLKSLTQLSSCSPAQWCPQLCH